MNLFKKLFSAAKDALKEASRERQLKASHKKYKATLEESLIRLESSLEEKILDPNYSFEIIISDYEDIEIKKDDLKLADRLYDYIFTEKKENIASSAVTNRN